MGKPAAAAAAAAQAKMLVQGQAGTGWGKQAYTRKRGLSQAAFQEGREDIFDWTEPG